MNTRLIRTGLIATAALAALCVGVPAFADGHGHGNGGGYAHSRGGYSPSRGAPSGGRVGMTPSRSGGMAAGRNFGAAPGRYIGAPSGRSFGSPSGRSFATAPPRSIAPSSRRGYVAAPGGRYAYPRAYNSPRYTTRPGFTARPGYSYARPSHSIGYSGRRYWGGGYYHGRYWPRSYFHVGFVPFVAVLPAFYSTYWWGGVPYYYWDDTYYTWSPSAYGYVATDPPPAAASDGDNDSDTTPNTGSADVYVYPKNGQSEEQTSQDRYECHQWAAGQSGFDPTKAAADQSSGSNGPSDYRRAMMACLDARGYSAR